MRWIADKYMYGDEKWVITNMVVGWNNASMLNDEEMEQQVELGMIDPRDVPDENYSPVTICITVSGFFQMESMMVKLDCINIADRPDDLAHYQSVYFN